MKKRNAGRWKRPIWMAALVLASGAVLHSNGISITPSPEEKEPESTASADSGSARWLYETIGLKKAGLDWETFQQALIGYFALEQKGWIKRPLLSIADFSQYSHCRRLYIIDLARRKLLKHTYVAHGRNSGDRMATRFSNQPSSLQSSLGFFVTKSTYQGSNGYSLKLEGIEKGINDKAMERAIVMHGADYVSEQMAERSGRIGRSWGCPAVAMEEHREIIDLIKNGSCLFISAKQDQYLAASRLLRTANATWPVTSGL